MSVYLTLFVNQILRFVFLMTPFFVLTMFLSMTQDWETTARRRLALRIGLAAFCICTVLLFFGRYIFQAFDITLDAFRIGGGALLFLSSVGLVNSKVTDKREGVALEEGSVSNIAVVPLAIPVTVGPGTIGAILVIGAESGSLQYQLITWLAVGGAIAILTVMLLLATWMEQKLGRQMIIILSKLTGLILAAMAAQMVFTGIQHFLMPETA